MDDKDEVAVFKLVQDSAQLSAIVIGCELAVVFVVPIAQLTAFASVVKHAWRHWQVVQHLQFVKRVSNLLAVVFHDVFFEKGLILALQHCLFILVRIILAEARNGVTLDDRTKQLEDLLFNAPTSCVLAQNEEA